IAFLPNRQILDGPFIINEILSWCNRKKKQAMIFKVDFAKAYDSIRWDYLDDVLNSFGFGTKWRDWIRVDDSIFTGIRIDPNLVISHFFTRMTQCLLKSHLLGIGICDSIVSAAASLIGCLILKTAFKYLGVLVGGNMSLIMSWDDTEDRKIAWVKWSRVLPLKIHGGLGVSSFFALNRVLLAKWVWRFLSHDSSLWYRVISSIHESNAQLSAAHWSLCKSIINSTNSLKEQGMYILSHIKIQIAASSIGCLILKTAFKYLGVLVGGNMSLIMSWDDTVAKLVKRLSKWKLKTLSIGRRLTLLKSVLGSTLIYNMSLFKVPKAILNTMEGL
nr:RNA-directed DNA polymerase, eukaryota [Tanacetum cinerariifolium]